jgi:glycosyltransferase involved in cell wall biosynthesis
MSERSLREGKIKVGVDLHVVDGKFQGTRTHVLELFSNLVMISPDIEFYFFLNKPESLLDLSYAFSAKNVKLVRMNESNSLKRLQWDLPRLIRRFGLDSIHTQYMLPRSANCKRIVTIHDILFETHPQFFTPLFVARSKLLMRFAAKSADHVFTVSEFCRSEISRLYHVPRDNISVILNGVAYDRFAISSANDDEVLRSRGLRPGGYLLSVGRLEPRKNQDGLLRAYAMLGPDAPHLVLVGQRDFRFNDVFRTIDELGLGPRVRVIEDVTDQELPALYRRAMLFVYPSFAEGFGMPVIEAMAAGAPVITSNTTALHEVVGDHGAVLIDPANVSELSLALAKIIDDTALRDRLRAHGYARARLFNWREAATKVRDQYLRQLGLNSQI